MIENTLKLIGINATSHAGKETQIHICAATAVDRVQAASDWRFNKHGMRFSDEAKFFYNDKAWLTYSFRPGYDGSVYLLTARINGHTERPEDDLSAMMKECFKAYKELYEKELQK